MNFSTLHGFMGSDNDNNVFPLGDNFPDKELEKGASISDRILSLGVPETELTESVQLVLSALMEKADDATIALEDAYQQLDEMESLVDVDTLTPMPNKRAFMRRLNWAISMLDRYGHKSTLVFFDLNDFKQINDEYGHVAGDAAIQHVADILLGCKRESDFLARMGGDEFAIIMFHANEEGAIRRANNIATQIKESNFSYEGKNLPLSAAVGCHSIKVGETAKIALHSADMEMFAHKKMNKVTS